MFWLFLNFMFSFYTALPCCFISQPFATLGGTRSGVSFSQMGTCLAVANLYFNTVSIYSSSSCSGYSSDSLVATISDGISFPVGVTFSADGTCLAVANQPLNGTGSITVYSSQTCAGYDKASPVATITNGINQPRLISFSADGSCLAVANNGNNSVTVYNSSSCSGYSGATPTPITLTAPPLGAALSPDGKCLAISIGVQNGSVELYSAGTSCGEYHSSDTINGFGFPTGVSFSPDGACLAVVDEANRNVQIYSLMNCGSHALTQSITTGVFQPLGVAFSQTGSCLAVTSANGPVTLYSTLNSSSCANYAPCATIGSAIFSPTAVAFSPAGGCLAVANNPPEEIATVTLYSATSCLGYNNASPVTTITDGIINPVGLSFSEDGTCLAVAQYCSHFSPGPCPSNVLLFNAQSCSQFSSPANTIPNNGYPTAVSFSRNGTCLAVADGNPGITIYNVANCNSETVATTISAGVNSPTGVAFTQEGSCLAVSNFNNVTLYPFTSCGMSNIPSPLPTITMGISRPSGLAFSPDSTCLAVANSPINDSGSVTVYTAQSCGGYNGASPVATITNGIFSPSGVSFSPDGSCLAVANNRANSVTFYTKLNPVITGPNLVCQGNSASLFADVSPFQDNTNPTYLTYQWLLNGALISGATGNTFTTDATLAPATYVYRVQVSDPSGCGPVTSAAFNVVVDGVIGTAGSFTACSGVALQGTVSATSSSGIAITTYNFSQPGHGQLGSLTSSNGSFVYTPNTGYIGSDSFTFTATDANGCTSAPVAVTIAVDSVVGTPASFSTCSGVSLPGTVSATSSSGSAITTYNFSQPGHGQLSSLTSPVGSFVYTSNSGFSGNDSFTFTATDANGCVSAPATVTINVDNAAVVLSSLGVLPNVGVPVTLVATPTGGIAPFTFKWSDGLVQTGSSAVSRVVEPVVTTSYSVIIIDSKGCQSDPSNTLTVSEVTRSSLSQALQAKYCVAG